MILLISLMCFHLPVVITVITLLVKQMVSYVLVVLDPTARILIHSWGACVSIKPLNEQDAGLTVSAGRSFATHFWPDWLQCGGLYIPVANTIQCRLIRWWSRHFLRFKMTDLEAEQCVSE